jgi:hypothetical protein
MTLDTITDDTTPVLSWDELKQEPAIAAAELERWRRVRTTTIDRARQHGWTKTEFSKRSAIPAGTLYGWLDGSYRGSFANVTDRVERFLDAQAELAAAGSKIPQAPGYVPTPTSKKVVDALIYSQTMPEIAVIVLAAGMGKTITLNHYSSMRPNVVMLTVRPSTTTVYKLMSELGDTLNLNDVERMPNHIDRAVGARLRRNGRSTLLVVDEAQHLKDEAVNQLRYFYDIYGVGIALVGNEELYGRFGDTPKPAYAQLQSRFGLKVRQMAPARGDIEAVLDAWGIEDPQIRQLGVAIGRKPGTLRQLTKTLQLAGMIAAGDERAMTAADVTMAAQQRGLEPSHA